MADISERLIERLRNRDEQSFDIIYDQYYKLVYYVAYEILNDSTEAEDILQETFIKLMDNIESYNYNGNFKAYITTIAKNLALNEYKKRKTHEITSLPEDVSYQDDHSKFNVILTLESTLDNDLATIVKYKILYEYSFQEIADELNLSIGTVQSQYYIAIKKLKKHFIETEAK